MLVTADGKRDRVTTDIGSRDKSNAFANDRKRLKPKQVRTNPTLAKPKARLNGP